MTDSNFEHSFNQTLKVASALAICLIVAIHYNSKMFISLDGTYTLNYLFQEWVTNSVGRAAVPFFAFASGYFFFKQFKGLNSYFRQTKKRLSSLLVPFLLAVSFIFLYDLGLSLIKSDPFDLTLSSYLTYIMHPDSVQFWFLRDLIFITFFLSPLLYFFIISTPLIFLSVLFALWITETQLSPQAFGWYVVSIEVLFFFQLGGLLSKRPQGLEKLVNAAFEYWKYFFIFFLLFSVLRVFLYPEFSVWYGVKNGDVFALILYKINILLGIPCLFLISHAVKDSHFLNWISGYSFFIFLYHIKPVSIFSINGASLILPDEYLFYLTTPLSIALCLVSAVILKRVTPRFFHLLTGGR